MIEAVRSIVDALFNFVGGVPLNKPDDNDDFEFTFSFLGKEDDDSSEPSMDSSMSKKIKCV